MPPLFEEHEISLLRILMDREATTVEQAGRRNRRLSILQLGKRYLAVRVNERLLVDSAESDLCTHYPTQLSHNLPPGLLGSVCSRHTSGCPFLNLHRNNQRHPSAGPNIRLSQSARRAGMFDGVERFPEITTPVLHFEGDLSGSSLSPLDCYLHNEKPRTINIHHHLTMSKSHIATQLTSDAAHDFTHPSRQSPISYRRYGTAPAPLIRRRIFLRPLLLRVTYRAQVSSSKLAEVIRRLINSVSPHACRHILTV
jgi:hypothetical protein